MEHGKPTNLQEAYEELHKWALLSTQDMKFYIGLFNALEYLAKFRKEK